MQNSEARVIAQVESVRDVVDHLSRSNIILNIGYHGFNAYPYLTTTAPPSNMLLPSHDFILFFLSCIA